MSIFARRLLPLGLLCSLAAFACSNTPTVPLTDNLSKQTVEVGASFDRRLQDRFPLASSDKDLGKELEKNGFQRTDWTTVVAEEHRAHRTECGFPCRRDFDVYWHSDGNGRLTGIRGTAFVTCL